MDMQTVSPERYKELIWFCRQYDDWFTKRLDILSARSSSILQVNSGKEVLDKIEEDAINLCLYEQNLGMVEESLQVISDKLERRAIGRFLLYGEDPVVVLKDCHPMKPEQFNKKVMAVISRLDALRR